MTKDEVEFQWRLVIVRKSDNVQLTPQIRVDHILPKAEQTKIEDQIFEQFKQQWDELPEDKRP